MKIQTRTERVATLSESYIDEDGQIHVLAGWDQTACGEPTVGDGPPPFTQCSACTRCIEAVIQARTRLRRERQKAAIHQVLLHLRRKR